MSSLIRQHEREAEHHTSQHLNMDLSYRSTGSSGNSNRTPRHSHNHEDRNHNNNLPRTPTGSRSSASGDSNKENAKSSSTHRHRRISMPDAMPSTPVHHVSPRRLSALTHPADIDNDDIFEAIHYADGLPTILFSGALQSDNVDRVIPATTQLKGFLRSSHAVEHSRQFVALGGHALLVMAMKKWQYHQVIQYRLCASMADFTYYFPNHLNDLNIFDALVTMGGMDLVVAAMARFHTIEAFQYTCMLVIGNLCTDVGRQESKENHADQFVHRLQGVHLVCNAMKEFAENETIQQTGTWLFEVLCALGLAKASVMKGEALASVALAVQAFPNNGDLNKDARSFMKMVIK